MTLSQDSAGRLKRNTQPLITHLRINALRTDEHCGGEHGIDVLRHPGAADPLGALIPSLEIL